MRRQLEAAIAERDEARAQQAALAEVLRAINASTGDFAPVFDLIIARAMALCGAPLGSLLAYENRQLTLLAERNSPAPLIEYWSRPQVVAPESGTARALHEGKTVQIADLSKIDSYLKDRLPMTVASVDLGNIRTLVQVPLVGERETIGLFNLYRQEVRPFTKAQIALVESFAAQATLAMENARRFAEQRESLEQQTATSEVLEVINASPGDLEPVFGAMLERAMHLCEAAFGIFGRFDGKLFEPVVDRDVPPELIATTRQIQSPPPNSGLGRLAAGESVVQLVDIANTDVYRAGFVGATALVDIGGARTAIFVALRKDGVLLGVIVMYRREVRAFSDKQVALLQNFAAQAVIAMENARLLTEQREALEQQTATAEILRVISQSPTDVRPVLDAVVKAAVRFCGAEDAIVALRDGDGWQGVAHEGPMGAPIMRILPVDRTTAPGQSMAERQTIQFPDIEELDPVDHAHELEAARRMGFRAVASAPMLRDQTAIGAVALRRKEPGAFTARQIELLESFAAQAVIAIENVRLFAELRDSLEQQTATADILRVISQSPTDVQPVLDAVADSARLLCGSDHVHVHMTDGNELVTRASASAPQAAGTLSQLRIPIDRRSAAGRAVLEGRTMHLPNVMSLDATEYGKAQELAKVGGFGTLLSAPMIRDGVAVGVITLPKTSVEPFTPRQIALLETFAAQAVIAIENVRLFTELKESLDQQTATADILRVISQSPTDVQPVLNVVVKAAQRFCGADDVVISLRDGDELAIAAHDGPIEAPPPRRKLDRSTTQGRAVIDAKTIHLPDISQVDPSEWSALVALSQRFGAKASLAAPMLREGTAVGAIMLRRREAGPFTERQMALLEAFAAQAVIAIENVRLFTELKESLEYQTATSELLEVISRSTSDIQPVLDTLLASAARLCGAELCAMIVRRDGRFRYQAFYGDQPDIQRAMAAQEVVPGRGSIAGRTLLDAEVVHVHDLQADPEYALPAVLKSGIRTALGVPLMRDGEPIGVINLTRARVEPFTDRQIELVRTFADQAVIAMENARLLGELRNRTDDLTESLEYQTATSEVLAVISRSPADLQPVLEAMTAAAVRLCGVKTGGLSVRRGDTLQFVALVGQTPEFEKWQMSAPLPIERGILIAHAVLDKEPVQIVDVMETDAYKAGAEVERAVVDLGGHRTILHVPLLRDDEAVGVLTVSRSEPLAFTERQIGLIETFADQAVIAMENARLLSELRESLDQQTATAEILQVINASPGNLTPVFQTILEKAHSTCGADMGSLFEWDGTHVRAVATLGYDPEIDEILREPHSLIPAMVDLMSGQRVFHRIYEQDRVNDGSHPFGPRFLAGSRIRTNLIIPLRKDDSILGFISANRREVRAYSDKEIALLENFAAQAVIAMENARLLTELRERTDDLTESLEYQTATSEVLEVISRSTTDLQPVLDTLLASAARLCGAGISGVVIRQADGFRYRALIGGATPEMAKALRAREIIPGRASIAGRALLEAGIVHVADLHADSDYALPEVLREVRTALGVPLMREGEPIGVITVTRDRVEPFTDRQIALVKTFADQAVIAMENARLLSELTRREEELRVTFDHMGDGVAMFDAGLKLASWNRNFQELLDIPDSFLEGRPGLEDYVRLLVRRGEVGHDNPDEEIARYRDRADSAWTSERTRPDGRIIEVRNNPVPGGGSVLIYSDITERKKAEAEIAAARDAAEAALERQTATADILKVIASSPTDVGPVMTAVARAALRFCGATDSLVHLREGDKARLTAHEGDIDVGPVGMLLPLTRDHAVGRAIVDAAACHIPDYDALDRADWPTARALSRDHGHKAGLAVPMLREGAAVGAIMLRKPAAEPFTPSQIQLLETFAAQAVIAIENVRLFTELRDSLERLKAAQANLIQSEKMATLGQLTAGIAHEIKNPLNFVNNFATLSVDLLAELKDVAEPALATLDEDKRAELDETMSLLVSNLQKINEHGKRADGIVKSMLSHSRGGAGDWQKSDINALVEEALNLAYHGARASDKEFNVTLERDLEKTGKLIEVVPQDVTRVFLNLFGNGFYAANKRRLGTRQPGFRPTLKVTTRDLGDTVEVKVRDNGIGMPPEVKEKLFQPFFTTKPTGEGTGLGLSISYDIVTQQHGGTIDVESETNNYTEFTVRLPRARRVAEAARGS